MKTIHVVMQSRSDGRDTINLPVEAYWDKTRADGVAAQLMSVAGSSVHGTTLVRAWVNSLSIVDEEPKRNY